MGTVPSIGLAARVQQQHAFTDMLLKSYENNLTARSLVPPPVLPPHSAYGPLGLAGPLSIPSLGPYQTALMGMSTPPQPGTFQHLLASMTASVKAKEAADSEDRSSSISPTQSGSPSERSTPPSGSTDRRSSSIAALRHKAREYEFKLQMGQTIKNVVF